LARLESTYQSHTANRRTCEPLIDAAEAADLLKVHPKTVKRMAAQGRLPGLRIGRLWRFRASELDDWMRICLNSGSHPRLESEER
jgi:excisionase family DNA binding protein